MNPCVSMSNSFLLFFLIVSCCKNAFKTWLTYFYHVSIHLLYFIIYYYWSFFPSWHPLFDFCNPVFLFLLFLPVFLGTYKCILNSAFKPLLSPCSFHWLSSSPISSGLTPVLMTWKFTHSALFAEFNLCFKLPIEHIYQNIFHILQTELVVELIFLCLRVICPPYSLVLLLVSILIAYQSHIWLSSPLAVSIFCQLFLLAL